MANLSKLDYSKACDRAVKDWSSPNKNFTSGFDPRSSDNALLTLMFGGLSHAQTNNWLNAGRRLIDKTYIHILFATQGLSSIPFINAELTASELDEFIREIIAPRWSVINSTNNNDKNEVANELVNIASKTLFGSLESYTAASHILFYLCPALAVFPYSTRHITALKKMGYTNIAEDYSTYSATCLKAMTSVESTFASSPSPEAVYGNTFEVNLINVLLNETNWWQRNLFNKLLLIRSE